MIKSEQASLSVMRIAVITIFAICMLSVCVLASSTDVKNVKIVLSDNCEIDVLTTKKVVADILEENRIVILPEENVVPNLTSEITDAYSAVAIAEEEGGVRLDQLLSAYNRVTEKIVEIEEAIPYQTVTKDASKPNDAVVTAVLQEGKDGLKKSTYKVKYQNEIEINRTLIKEEIIEQAVDKIVQVTNVTNRSASSELRTNPATHAENKSALASKVEGITPIVKTLNASAYTAVNRT